MTIELAQDQNETYAPKAAYFQGTDEFNEQNITPVKNVIDLTSHPFNGITIPKGLIMSAPHVEQPIVVIAGSKPEAAATHTTVMGSPAIPEEPIRIIAHEANTAAPDPAFPSGASAEPMPASMMGLVSTDPVNHQNDSFDEMDEARLKGDKTLPVKIKTQLRTPEENQQIKKPKHKKPQGLADLSPLKEFNGHNGFNPKRRPAPINNVLQSDKARDYLRKHVANSVVIGDDGVTHINYSSIAVTPLGKMLGINSLTPFSHPELGPFQSLGGLWCYLCDPEQNDKFRTMCGTPCRKAGDAMGIRNIDAMGKVVVAETTWVKVVSNPQLKNWMAGCELEFKSYFTHGESNVRIATSEAWWYNLVLNEISATLKRIEEEKDENLFPDFTFIENMIPPQQYRPRY
jgi:hypothetical protein